MRISLANRVTFAWMLVSLLTGFCMWWISGTGRNVSKRSVSK